jgi:hypothetical protein
LILSIRGKQVIKFFVREFLSGHSDSLAVKIARLEFSACQ